MIILVILLGIFLRLYGFPGTYFFEGELGKELLYMRQYNLLHKLPLIGMATSHEWLSYGPIYYWVMIPIFNLFKGDPFILFWSALTVSTIGLVLNYFVFRKIAGEKIALVSTAIQALSPLLIWITRLSKLHTFFFVLSPIFTFALYEIWRGNKRWVFWAGLTYGIMFSFHFSQIPLLLVVVALFYIKRKMYKFYDYLKFAAGVIIPNLTLIWQDKLLIAWLPYRVANIPDKNPAGTIQSFDQYMGLNIFSDQRFWILGSLIFISIFIHYIIKNKKNFSKDFLTFYLISSISIMFIANILHGAPPVHYFLPIFTTVPVLLALYLEKIKFWPIILIVVTIINFTSLYDKPSNFIPYDRQLAIASFIVSDAKGKDISVKRIGPYDYFPEEYSQNYKYLILWQGGNLIDNSKNIYTINENLGTVPK